jgi:hypothetical protein
MAEVRAALRPYGRLLLRVGLVLAAGGVELGMLAAKWLERQ